MLRFMEAHEKLDFGAPGPLVHFVERTPRAEYDDILMESVSRRPTAHTVCMLHRVQNGTKQQAARERVLSVMRRVETHPRASEPAKQAAREFLAYQGEPRT